MCNLFLNRYLGFCFNYESHESARIRPLLSVRDERSLPSVRDNGFAWIRVIRSFLCRRFRLCPVDTAGSNRLIEKKLIRARPGMAVTHRVVAERLVYHDPEGVEHISPGQRPGSSARIESSPERAPHKSEMTTSDVSDVTPLQGLSFPRLSPCRALPWAGMSRPFRAGYLDVTPLQGSSFPHLSPCRALPWAGMSRPFRAGYRNPVPESRKNSGGLNDYGEANRKKCMKV